MKLFEQIGFLQLIAVTVLSIGQNAWATEPNASLSSDDAVGCGQHGGVLGADGTERPINPDNPDEVACSAAGHAAAQFMDSSALASLSSPPSNGCGAASAKAINGKTSWQRGYDQAMSGERFEVPISTRTGTLRAELKACSEYTKGGLSPSEKGCCLDGFHRGYADLQRLILNYLQHKQPAPMSDAAKLCYQAFGEGRHAARIKCRELSGSALSCNPPQISPNTRHLGCASLGYLAELRQCPVVQAEQRALSRALNGGALSGARLPANVDLGEDATNEIVPAAGGARSGNATGTGLDREPE